MDTIRLIHAADLHLGFTGNTSLVHNIGHPAVGRPIREVDIEEAVKWLTRSIRSADPPIDVLLIAGDLFHRSVPLPRTVAFAARFIHRIVEHGVDVVIIDGNHEVASATDIGSPTGYLRELGAHVVNIPQYSVIRDNEWRNPRLRGRLAVHALSYQMIQEGDFTGVSPLPGCLNVLLSHGRVHGMDDLNSLHRTSSWIPAHILRQPWDYIALGDWHIHRYQPLGDTPAYYAGSIEALNFGEASWYPDRRDDAYAIRGVLDARLATSKPVEVLSIPYNGRRPVLRLSPIDAAELEPSELMDALRKRLSNQLPAEALVLLDVRSCPAHIRDQLDFVEIDQLRQRVLRCDIRWDIVRPEQSQSAESPSEESLTDQWKEFLAQQIPEEAERTWFLAEGSARIDAARSRILSAQANAGKE